MKKEIIIWFVKNRIVFSERNNPRKVPIGWHQQALRNFAFRFADALVFQTEDARSYFPESVQKRGVIIPNPINGKLPPPIEGEREKTIVTACRLHPQKNLPMMINAFSMLADEFPEYKLVIYGQGVLEDELRAQIKALNLENRILLPGFASNILEKVAPCSMYVSSSDFEGISNSMLEALGMGLPAVVTDCPVGGARMVINSGENGILVPVGDTKAMYEAMRSILKDTAIADRMIWFITLIFLVLSLTISFALGDANYGAYVLFVCLFGLIIFYLIREQGVIKFRFTWMHGYMLLFIGACYLSTINAIEPSVALSRSFDIVKIFFMLIILYMCYQDKTSVDTLLKIGMWTGYIVCFYTVYFYGLDYFITVLSSSARIANDALNANTVGLLGANAIVMTLYYMLYDRPRWWNIIALPTLGILAATGSRKALVFVVVGTVLLFVFKSLRSANVVNSIAKIIGSLLALTIIGIAVLQLPMFSEVLDRMSSMVDAFSGTGGDSSTIIRLALVDIGWDLFYQSPITGVGVNNPSVLTYFLYGKENYYLHNNYIELLAGTGIIGLLAYYSMYVYIAYNLIRYRNFHSNEYVMVLILFLSQIVMDMGMVSYESKSTYFYMMMFYLEVQLLRKGRKNEAQQVM